MERVGEAALALEAGRVVAIAGPTGNLRFVAARAPREFGIALCCSMDTPEGPATGYRLLVRDVPAGGIEPMDIREYADAGRLGATIAAAVHDSVLARSLFEGAAIRTYLDVAEAVAALQRGEVHAVFGAQSPLRTRLSDPAIGTSAYLCCRRGNPHDPATQVSSLRRGAPIFLKPEDWRSTTPPVLYRVHPARDLVPFRATTAGQKIWVTARSTGTRYPLAVTVFGHGVEERGYFFRRSFELRSNPDTAIAEEEVRTFVLSKPGLYYVRGYTEATFAANANSVKLEARLLDVADRRQWALVDKSFANVVNDYPDLANPNISLLALENSPGEALMERLFPGKPLQRFGSLDELMRHFATSKDSAAFLDADLVDDVVHENRRVFRCCGRTIGDALVSDVPVPTNLLTADLGNDRYFSPAGQVLPNLVGEVPYSLDTIWAGGYRGFSMGSCVPVMSLPALGC